MATLCPSTIKFEIFRRNGVCLYIEEVEKACFTFCTGWDTEGYHASSDLPVVNKQVAVEDIGASQLCASIQFVFSFPGTEMANI